MMQKTLVGDLDLIFIFASSSTHRPLPYVTKSSSASNAYSRHMRGLSGRERDTARRAGRVPSGFDEGRQRRVWRVEVLKMSLPCTTMHPDCETRFCALSRPPALPRRALRPTCLNSCLGHGIISRDCYSGRWLISCCFLPQLVMRCPRLTFLRPIGLRVQYKGPPTSDSV